MTLVNVPGVGQVHTNHLGYDVSAGVYQPVWDFVGGPIEGAAAADYNWQYSTPGRDGYAPIAPPNAATPASVARNLGGWLPWMALKSFIGFGCTYAAESWVTQSFRDALAVEEFYETNQLMGYQWALISYAADHWRPDTPPGESAGTYATTYDLSDSTDRSTLATHVRDSTTGSSLAAICIDFSASFGIDSTDPEFAVVQAIAAEVDDVVIVSFAGWGTDDQATFDFDGSSIVIDRDPDAGYATPLGDRSADTMWSGPSGSLPTGTAWDALTPNWGGNETPETHLDAMRHAIGWAAANGSWATKHLVVMSEAPWIAPLDRLGGTRPRIRQSQRDDIRASQLTSRQRSIRQNAYL
jgi:hypothetical protein